jgi:hypothetical protein
LNLPDPGATPGVTPNWPCVARKFETRIRDRIDLHDARRQWLERVLRELVKRQGQFGAGAVRAEFFENRMP